MHISPFTLYIQQIFMIIKDFKPLFQIEPFDSVYYKEACTNMALYFLKEA